MKKSILGVFVFGLVGCGSVVVEYDDILKAKNYCKDKGGLRSVGAVSIGIDEKLDYMVVYCKNDKNIIFEK